MTTRTVVPAGAPIWIDLTTSDLEASRAFYGELFGWTSEEPDPELGNYLNFTYDGERVAGCMPTMDATDGSPSDVWTVYLASDDAEKTCAAVLEAGGTVHAPTMDVRDLGRMAIFSDPTGAPFGVWEPGTHRGLLTLATPGHAAWFELITRDHDATLRFGQEVFGWVPEPVADQPGFRYTTGRINGEDQVGLMTTGEQRPEGSTGVAADAEAQWSVYFSVDDSDVALARAVELGATIVHPVDDSPYGRLGAFTDPTGSLVKVIS